MRYFQSFNFAQNALNFVKFFLSVYENIIMIFSEIASFQSYFFCSNE